MSRQLQSLQRGWNSLYGLQTRFLAQLCRNLRSLQRPWNSVLPPAGRQASLLQAAVRVKRNRLYTGMQAELVRCVSRQLQPVFSRLFNMQWQSDLLHRLQDHACVLLPVSVYDKMSNVHWWNRSRLWLPGGRVFGPISYLQALR